MSKQLFYGHQPRYFVALPPTSWRPWLDGKVHATRNASCGGDVRCRVVYK